MQELEYKVTIPSEDVHNLIANVSDEYKYNEPRDIFVFMQKEGDPSKEYAAANSTIYPLGFKAGDGIYPDHFFISMNEEDYKDIDKSKIFMFVNSKDGHKQLFSDQIYISADVLKDGNDNITINTDNIVPSIQEENNEDDLNTARLDDTNLGNLFNNKNERVIGDWADDNMSLEDIEKRFKNL